MTRDQIKAALAAALEALPVLGERRYMIPREAERLYLIAGLARFKDLPRAKRVKDDAARAEIETLAKLSNKLGRHVQTMHRDSLAAIEAAQGDAMHPLMLFDEIRKLRAAIDRAEVASGDGPRGAPAKHQARETTLACAKAYESLTCKKATSSNSAFVEMVNNVFAIFGIDASAQGQAKAHLND